LTSQSLMHWRESFSVPQYRLFIAWFFYSISSLWRWSQREYALICVMLWSWHVQLDFQLPVQFNLSFSTEDEARRERPVMIHRAVLGSVERMFAILLEHYAGKWPFWLSPRQAIVCSISEKFAPNVLEVSNLACHQLTFSLCQLKLYAVCSLKAMWQ
jgi:hypothetical protein